MDMRPLTKNDYLCIINGASLRYVKNKSFITNNYLVTLS